VCRSCSCIISALKTFSGVGLHALLILKTLVLLVLLLLNPLLSNRWLLLDHNEFPSTGHGFKTTKTIIKYCPDAGLQSFVVSKATGGRSLFDHSFRLYIYVFIRKKRIYTPAKIHQGWS
jgi:hypothetical protein